MTTAEAKIKLSKMSDLKLINFSRFVVDAIDKAQAKGDLKTSSNALDLADLITEELKSRTDKPIKESSKLGSTIERKCDFSMTLTKNGEFTFNKK